MTSTVTSGTPMPPAAAAPAVGAQPDSVTGTMQPTTHTLVDDALASVLGVDVIGGGADAPSSDPAAGIPAFVRQYLPNQTGQSVPQAIEGAYPPGKGTTGAGQVQQGWAWIGRAPNPPTPEPPSKDEPPMLPTKGELPPPPTKGEPPTKGPGAVDQVGEVDRGRGTHAVRAGEYLSIIAPKYGLTWRQLYWANRDQIKHPDLIHPGQVLKIPPCDLKVPNFDYKPMFTGPAKPHTPGTHNAPKQATPPTKGDTPPAKTPRAKTPPTSPPPAPPVDTETPPGTPDGTLPPAPPVPEQGELPPSLPD